MKRFDSVVTWAKLVKRDVYAVWLAARDPRTPLIAKYLALAVAAYAVSPIDLIPDFIPVFGYLDDLIIIPLGLLLVIRLMPQDLMLEFRQKADQQELRPVSVMAAVVIISLWIMCLAFVVYVSFWRK